ncbi:unannotated protein [freshwater metagenome]|uniref:Unannotated protein n=1 Tax=freshwater metagenome TaxID=449393 RepID=A0A6J7CLA5_9ZZZZ
MEADRKSGSVSPEITDAGAHPLIANRYLSLDWFDWLCLALLTLLSMVVLAPLLLKGRMLSGADGLFPPDQMQYLTWIREAGDHWLIGNEFDMRTDHRVFLHPGFLLSGIVHRWLGASLAVSFIAVWKPLAVAVAFVGCLKYTRRLLPRGWPARVGLVIALFVVMPWSGLAKTTGWGGAPGQYQLDFISGELWTVQTLLGYMMTAVAVFAMPLVLLGVERGRQGGHRALLTACAAGGAWVMWLQPWQGAELILIIVAVELWRRVRDKEPIAWRLTPVLVVSGLPAVYYAVLSATDSSWELAGKANAAGAQPLWEWPLWMVAITLLPLLIPAALGLGRRADDWQQVAVRVWPFAVLAVFFQPFGTFPYHSVQGLTLPLGILAVQGLTVHRPKWVPKPHWIWVVPVLALFIIPGTAHKVRLVRNNIHNVAYPYYIFSGEEAALSWLERDNRPGAVLASSYGGLLVAPYAGREVYLGPFSWTPSWELRARVTGAFFGDQLRPRYAQRFVKSTGARYVFQECQGRVEPPLSLSHELGQLVQSVHTFGCARVYVLKPTGRSDRVSARVGKPIVR